MLQWRSQNLKIGGNMASAGARAYMGVWGRSLQLGPGAEPLVRGYEGKAPRSWRYFAFEIDAVLA